MPPGGPSGAKRLERRRGLGVRRVGLGHGLRDGGPGGVGLRLQGRQGGRDRVRGEGPIAAARKHKERAVRRLARRAEEFQVQDGARTVGPGVLEAGQGPDHPGAAKLLGQVRPEARLGAREFHGGDARPPQAQEEVALEGELQDHAAVEAHEDRLGRPLDLGRRGGHRRSGGQAYNRAAQARRRRDSVHRRPFVQPASPSPAPRAGLVALGPRRAIAFISPR
jgi:hypothetical protein